LEDVALDRGDLEPTELLRGVAEDVRVRIDERDPAAIGKPRAFDEPACPGSDIEMVVADVAAVSLDQRSFGRPPDGPGYEADHDTVVGPEQCGGVVRLTSVRWVVSIHRVSRLPSGVGGRSIGGDRADDAPAGLVRPP